MSDKKTINLTMRAGGGTILNDPAYHSVASVSYRVQVNASADEGSGATKYKNVDGSITISDCNKSITLDLGFSTQAMYENNQHKIDRLIEILQKCKQDMQAMNEKYKELPERANEIDTTTLESFMENVQKVK